MTIYQLVHTLNYGDAISGEAIAIQAMLRQAGMQSQIFSLHAHEKVAAETLELARCAEMISAATQPVVVILHYSIASPINQLYRELAGKATRAMIYHNLTPEHWFESYNQRVYADLVVARKELKELAEVSDVLIADSTHNKQELLELGCSEVIVLPLLLDDAKWNVAANPGIAAALRGHGGKNILHVGRIAPNKCLEDIIKGFYFYHHKIDRKSKLWLVGADVDTEIYSFELRTLVAELRLQEAVEFVGCVSDGELKAFYQEADLYVCMSEHEGFCVPLLEAMNFGVPIVAYGSTAIPETLADAGIVVGQKDPAMLAELINICISRSEIREPLVAAGHKRVLDFSSAVFKENLQKLCVSFAQVGKERDAQKRFNS